MRAVSLAAALAALLRRADGHSAEHYAAECPNKLDAVYADMHDGDKKRVSVLGAAMKILPSGNNESWEVDTVVVRPVCWSVVDFRVPGKPSPPPVDLYAFHWTAFGVAPNGKLVSKAVYEFNDPSGTLAHPADPLNHWVQLPEQYEALEPAGAAASSCGKILGILGQSRQALFADMHDGDTKHVSFSESSMTITPSGNNQTWVVNATLDLTFCNASVDFAVPGKPSPPPVPLTATLWSSTAWGPEGQVWKTLVEFTDPSGTLAGASLPLNHWVQLGVRLPGPAAAQLV